MNPNYGEAFAARGIALLHQMKDTEAQQDFMRAHQLNPSGKEALEKQILSIKERRDQK